MYVPVEKTVEQLSQPVLINPLVLTLLILFHIYVKKVNNNLTVN